MSEVTGWARLDQEAERQERRLGAEIFQPPVVRTLMDIKRLLAEIDPSKSVAQSIPMASKLSVSDKGHLITYGVSARTQTQSKRSIIVEGFKFIKARQELEERARRDVAPILINGREMTPVVTQTISGRTWVDPLVERWFNATRDGLRICWTVNDGKFCYDVLEHKLFRVK